MVPPAPRGSKGWGGGGSGVLGRCGDQLHTAIPRELHRVTQEIDEHLLHPPGVGDQRGQRSRDVHGDGHAPRVGERLDGRHYRVHDPGHRTALQLQVEPTSGQLGQLEDVVDECSQRGGITMRFPDPVPRARPERVISLLEHQRVVAENRVHRIP